MWQCILKEPLNFFISFDQNIPIPKNLHWEITEEPHKYFYAKMFIAVLVKPTRNQPKGPNKREYICIYMHIYVYICVYLCVTIYIVIIHIIICIYLHTHTHTHINKREKLIMVANCNEMLSKQPLKT